VTTKVQLELASQMFGPKRSSLDLNASNQKLINMTE